MKYLQPKTEEQTISIIPRDYNEDITILLRDDSTNKEVFITPNSVTKSQNQLEVVAIFDLKEGRFYDLKILNNQSVIVYRDKVFCTFQGINQSDNDKYTPNKDLYKSFGSDNDFIIL